MYPGNVIREVMYRSYTRDRMLQARRLEDKTEPYVISIAVSKLRKCLPRKTVTEIVYPMTAYGPGMSGSKPAWVVPHFGGNRIRKPLRKALQVVYDIQS